MVVVTIDFFFPFCTVYLHLDLFYITSPHDKLYFLRFSAIISFIKLGSYSTDLLFHLLLLFETPLTFRPFICVSVIANVFLLLPIFFNFILSLQNAFKSIFYLDFDKLPLISEATSEEWGLAIIIFAKDEFYFESFRSPMGSWPW